MRVTLIVNPVASSVTRRTMVLIQKALSADHKVNMVETTRKGQAIRLAHSAARAGADAIIALGGDGTINEVVNGVLDQDCRVAPLPGGSTNVFARSVGYSNDPTQAAGALVEALAADSYIPASIGLANGRAFLFHVGAGFDAAVVKRVEKRGPLKRYLGHPLFIASTFVTWFREAERRQSGFSVQIEDGRSIANVVFAVAMNTRPYTFLGTRPLDIAPEAGLDRPLSVLAVSTLSPLVVPTLVKAFIGDEGLPNKKRTRHLVNVENATIVGETPFPFQLDGEIMDPVTELKLTHMPNAIKLLVPPS